MQLQCLLNQTVRLFEEYIFRSSHPELFYKKSCPKNIVKFTGKHLCQSLLFNKVSDSAPVNLLKKGLWHRCCPVNFAKFLKPILCNTCK